MRRKQKKNNKSNRQRLADHLRRVYRNKTLWDVDKMSNRQVIINFKER